MAIAEASAGADFGIAAVKATARITGTSEAKAKQTLEEARNYAKETGFSQAVDKVRRTSKDATFDTSDESSRKAMAGIRASLDQSRQHTEQASANHTRSLGYKEAATRARENSGTWEAGLQNMFADWMTTQNGTIDGHAYKGFSKQELGGISVTRPFELEPYKDKFFKEVVEPRLAAGVGEVKTPADVRQLFEEGKNQVPSKENITEQGQQWLGQVQGAAAGAGVNPKARATSDIPKQVEAEQKTAGQRIEVGKTNVTVDGDNLAAEAKHGTDPTKQNLLGNATANAVAKVVPDGTTYLLDKVGAIPGGASVAKPVADNYKGDRLTAALETGLFVGSFFVGGPEAGGVVSKVGEWGVSKIATKEGAKVAEKVAANAAVKAEAGAAGRAAATEAQEAAVNAVPGAKALIGPPTPAAAAATVKAEADVAARVAAEKAAADMAAKGAGAARETEILAEGNKAGYGVGRVLFTEAIAHGADNLVIPAKDKLSSVVQTMGNDVDSANNAIRRAVGEVLPKPVDDVLEKVLNVSEQKIGEMIGTRPHEQAHTPAPVQGEHPVQSQAVAQGQAVEPHPAQAPAPAHQAEPHQPAVQGEARSVEQHPAQAPAPAGEHPGQSQTVAPAHQAEPHQPAVQGEARSVEQHPAQAPAPAGEHPVQPQGVAQGQAAEPHQPAVQGEARPVEQHPAPQGEARLHEPAQASAPTGEHPVQPQGVAQGQAAEPHQPAVQGEARSVEQHPAQAPAPAGEHPGQSQTVAPAHQAEPHQPAVQGEARSVEQHPAQAPAPAGEHPGQVQAVAQGQAVEPHPASAPAPAHQAEPHQPAVQGEARPVEQHPAPQGEARLHEPAQASAPDSVAQVRTELANVTARAELAEARVGEVERLIQARGGGPRAAEGSAPPVSGVQAQSEQPPAQGESSKAESGSVLTAEAGTSNLGKVLSPRQRQAPPQPQQENATSTEGKGDVPPPSGR
jgi:hypothetical protein